MDQGLRWTAAFALMILLLGLLALSIGDPDEGPIEFTLDSQHAVRALDLLGAVLIAGATALAWAVGLTWQRRNMSPSHYRYDRYPLPDDEWRVGRSH